MATEVIPLVTGKLLLRLEEAKTALAKARDLFEVKGIRDFTQSAADLLKQQRLSQTAVFDALELKLWAERRLGELLHGNVRAGNPQLLPDETIGRLPKEISRIQSHRWQRSATVPADQFDDYLAQCRRRCEEPTTKGILRLACVRADAARNGDLTRRGELVGSLPELIATGRKFATVYADPPWPYANQGTRARTDRHYPTLPVEQIKRLPVGEVVADNAHLHLWATNAFVAEAIALMRDWGFTYKSIFVWCKPNYGIGNYWRVAHEFLLFGVRGKRPFRDRSQRSWQEFPRQKHSAKPGAIRKLVETVSPPPYLELFGRKRVAGWTVLGNEVG